MSIELAAQALRTIAVACRPLTGDPATACTDLVDDDERDLVHLGIVGILDPPRAEATAAIADAHAAGIRVLMITGDHPVTAATIGESTRHRGRRGRASPAPTSTTWTTTSSVVALARSRRVRPGGAGAQAPSGRGAPGRWSGGGDDRRRGQRRPGAAARRHRCGDGHDRHRGLEGGRRHDPRRRQLRHHPQRRPRGPRDLRRHPQGAALPAGIEHRRGAHDADRCAPRRRARPARRGWRPGGSAARDPDPVDQPPDRRCARDRAGRRSGRGGRDAPIRRAGSTSV